MRASRLRWVGPESESALKGYPLRAAGVPPPGSEPIADERARRGPQKQHVGHVVYRVHRLALLAEIHARPGLRAVLVELEQHVAVAFGGAGQHEDRPRDGERGFETLARERGCLVRVARELCPALRVRRRELSGEAACGGIRGVARRLGERLSVRRGGG